jgi:hypothetical protein
LPDGRRCLDPEIGVAGESGDGGLHLQFRSREHVNIELEAALQTVAMRQHGRLRAFLDVGAEVKSGSHGQLGDHHIAAEQSGIGGAGQADIGVGGGTYSRRITQANIVRGGAEIEKEDATLISRGPSQGTVPPPVVPLRLSI